jgi:hypothetical protein
MALISQPHHEPGQGILLWQTGRLDDDRQEREPDVVADFCAQGAGSRVELAYQA